MGGFHGRPRSREHPPRGREQRRGDQRRPEEITAGSGAAGAAERGHGADFELQPLRLPLGPAEAGQGRGGAAVEQPAQGRRGGRRRRVGGMHSGTPVRLRAAAAAGEAPGGEGLFPHRILVRAELGSSLELMCSRGSPGLCRAPPRLSDEKVKNYMRSVTQLS